MNSCDYVLDIPGNVLSPGVIRERLETVVSIPRPEKYPCLATSTTESSSGKLRVCLLSSFAK